MNLVDFHRSTTKKFTLQQVLCYFILKMIPIPILKYAISMEEEEYQELKAKKKNIEITLCSIETLKIQPYIKHFLPSEHLEIQRAIYNTASLQDLLKHIHYKFNDSGLISTLIHQIYQAKDHEIEFYVPELVYMAVINKNKELKKVLLKKSEESESLRRLILWNLKAMTVLMKNRDREIKDYVDNFENFITNIEKSEEDLKDFKNSEKAIAMLTTASLVLKKKNKEDQQKLLKQFIRKFNEVYLSTFNHKIIIPFRKSSENQDCRTNLVVRIIQDNCSCFPTRKRVPYRIILETVDAKEVGVKIEKNNRKFKTSIEKDSIFQEVLKQVQDNLKKKKQSDAPNDVYPFVVDLNVQKEIQDLNKYAKKVENDEKQLQKVTKTKLKTKRQDTMRSVVSKVFKKYDFKVRNNQQLQKFDATFIPLKPSSSRKSEPDYRKMQRAHYRSHEKRLSLIQSSDEQENQIRTIQEETTDFDLENKYKKIWGESWSQEIKKLRNNSRFKNEFKSLRYHNVVIKGGDDLRQEIICMQLIYKIKSILKEANLDIVIKPYEIIVLSENSGLLEFVSNSISIDGIKKLVINGESRTDLYQFFQDVFNTSDKFREAKIKFMKSLVGSSILTYVLRLKDRHNGNILIDREGHIIHIDFGFILGLSPGGINFESSPFKLTSEYVALLDGKDSPQYNHFKDLFCAGMNVLRKKCDQICLILQIMMQKSDLDCFQSFDIVTFKSRFQCNLTDEKFRTFCEGLVQKSCMNSRTAHYDAFQKFQNGIMP